jgi:hypothetical protein
MQIVKYYFNYPSKIGQVLAFMERSSGLIKIDDILPYFNDNINK